MPALNLNWWSVVLRGAKPHRLNYREITGIKIVSIGFGVVLGSFQEVVRLVLVGDCLALRWSL
jgi:hypothetical protein